jgi:hypothetical protein
MIRSLRHFAAKPKAAAKSYLMFPGATGAG